MRIARKSLELAVTYQALHLIRIAIVNRLSADVRRRHGAVGHAIVTPQFIDAEIEMATY